MNTRSGKGEKCPTCGKMCQKVSAEDWTPGHHGELIEILDHGLVECLEYQLATLKALRKSATIAVMRSSLLWSIVFVLAFAISAVGKLHLLHPALAVAGFVCSACFFFIGWLNSKRYRKGQR